MIPELIERLKQSCKLMAEKMPNKFEYLPRYTVYRDECIAVKGKIIRLSIVTQDDIDTLAFLLPEPRILVAEVSKEMINFSTQEPFNTFEIWTWDKDRKYIDTIWIGDCVLDKLSALVEGFCAEVERQLGK